MSELQQPEKKPEDRGTDWKVVAGPVVVGCLLAATVAQAQFTTPPAPPVAGQVQGQLYQNPQEGFELTIPAGWSIQPNANPADVVRVEFFTNDQNYAGSNCNVAIVRNPMWAGLTQAQINQNVQAGQLAAEIETEMRQAGQNGSVISSGTSMVGAVMVQNGEYGMDIPIDGGQLLRVYVVKYIAPVPGAFYNVNCSTRAAWTAALQPAFRLVLGSLKIAGS